MKWAVAPQSSSRLTYFAYSFWLCIQYVSTKIATTDTFHTTLSSLVVVVVVVVLKISRSRSVIKAGYCDLINVSNTMNLTLVKHTHTHTHVYFFPLLHIILFLSFLLFIFKAIYVGLVEGYFSFSTFLSPMILFFQYFSSYMFVLDY